MKKVKKFIKNNIKVVIAFILGISIAGSIGVYAATVIASASVSYDNSDSGLEATNLQDAIDEVYKNADIRKMKKIVSAYEYDESNCKYGYEDACIKTICYKNTNVGSCPSGTIIYYKVNKSDIHGFYVLFDEGNTMTLLSITNTISSIPWYASSATNTKGPITALESLEKATSHWLYVNNQTYTMGITVFKTNAYTGCTNSSCTKNSYRLPSRTAKARMITMQELWELDCIKDSCPKYLRGNAYGYWTMNASSNNEKNAMILNNSLPAGYGPFSTGDVTDIAGGMSVRAVVSISK